MNTKRSRYSSPDGHDWRDPEMPVVRQYRMPSGERKQEVDPNYERRYCKHKMQTAAQESWRNDPTYNLRRKNVRPRPF